MHAGGVITLTTDFGTRDPYVGIMKGIVLSINPDARLVDITHEIPAQDINNASFVIANSYEYFPSGTVHIGVVDPGVGGDRKNIGILTERYFFIGPDNGIFTIMSKKEKILEVREITNQPFILDKISDTFHGRDVFAPCAGHLSAGSFFSDIGPVIKNITSLEHPELTENRNILTGEMVSIDSFGNLITNLSIERFRLFTGNHGFEIYYASERFNKIGSHYVDVDFGKPLVLFGSSGYLEISMNGGSAEQYFMTTVGTTVTIRKF